MQIDDMDCALNLFTVFDPVDKKAIIVTTSNNLAYIDYNPARSTFRRAKYRSNR